MKHSFRFILFLTTASIISFLYVFDYFWYVSEQIRIHLILMLVLLLFFIFLSLLILKDRPLLFLSVPVFYLLPKILGIDHSPVNFISFFIVSSIAIIYVFAAKWWFRGDGIVR